MRFKVDFDYVLSDNICLHFVDDVCVYTNISDRLCRFQNFVLVLFIRERNGEGVWAGVKIKSGLTNKRDTSTALHLTSYLHLLASFKNGV